MTKKRASPASRKKKTGKVRTEARDLFDNIPHPADGKDPNVLDVGELMAQDDVAEQIARQATHPLNLPPIPEAWKNLVASPPPPPPEPPAVEPEPDPEHVEIASILADAHVASPTSNADPRKNMAKKTTRKRPADDAKAVAKIETTAEPPATEEPTEPGGIQDALAKLIRSVDLLRRQERYGQFSLTTLFGVCFQVLSAVLFLVLVIMIVSAVPLKTVAPIGIVNVLLQLMAMTFLLMNSRR